MRVGGTNLRAEIERLAEQFEGEVGGRTITARLRDALAATGTDFGLLAEERVQLEQIRERQKLDEAVDGPDFDWMQAHADRATLLSIVDRLVDSSSQN